MASVRDLGSHQCLASWYTIAELHPVVFWCEDISKERHQFSGDFNPKYFFWGGGGGQGAGKHITRKGQKLKVSAVQSLRS